MKTILKYKLKVGDVIFCKERFFRKFILGLFTKDAYSMVAIVTRYKGRIMIAGSHYEALRISDVETWMRENDYDVDILTPSVGPKDSDCLSLRINLREGKAYTTMYDRLVRGVFFKTQHLKLSSEHVCEFYRIESGIETTPDELYKILLQRNFEKK